MATLADLLIGVLSPRAAATLTGTPQARADLAQIQKEHEIVRAWMRGRSTPVPKD